MHVGIIGGGNLGAAFYKALSSRWGAEAIMLCDRHEDKLRSAGVKKLYTDPREVIKAAGTVIIAIKPQSFEEFTSQAGALLKDKLMVSVMAGVSLAKLSQLTGARRIVRAMPNLAVKTGQGLVGWMANPEVSGEERVLVRAMWEATGAQIEVQEERQLDAITALSGSGPAYFFYLCELLEEKAKAEGFSPAEACVIAQSTFLGAARLLGEGGRSARQWREAVTSQGGTTAAALNYLQEHEFGGIFKQAIAAAKKRAEELSQ